MSNDSEVLVDLLDEVGQIAFGRLGLNETNSTKFNFATIDKTENGIQYIEYWILANASYDYEAERFIKIDTTATSFGIQIQAKGTYPGEEEFDTKNTGVNIWRNPPKADVYKDTTTYDYTDFDNNNYIGAERRSDDVWVEFGLSAGWTNNLMTDSYGGVTIGGNGIEIDGSGIYPFTRVTNSSFNDGTSTYYIMGMLDNAYHPSGTTWKCDSNEKGAWFFGLKYPQTSGAKDSANAKFVVLYNDMSSIDPSATGYTIEDMDISDWETILEVSSTSIKGMVSGTLTTLGGSGGSSFDLVDSVTDGDTIHAVTPNAVYDAIATGIATKTITLTKQTTPETGFAATYVLYQGGTAISPKINIPKDFLVKSASVETCTTDDVPVEGYVVGDKYLDFVVNSVDSDDTDSHIYLKVTELVDIYDADNVTLELSSGNVFSIKDGGVTYAKIASAAIGTGANQIAAGNHTHNAYLEKSQTSYKGKNVVVDSATGDITFEDKPTIPDVSGKIDTAGTGLTKSGTTLSADIGGSSSTSASKLVACNDSRLSDSRTPSSHTHGNIDNGGILKISGTAQGNKNVVTDSNGKITTEAKPTIPTVVDVVADGNANAVSSNAVYDYIASIIGDIDTWLVS